MQPASPTAHDIASTLDPTPLALITLSAFFFLPSSRRRSYLREQTRASGPTS